MKTHETTLKDGRSLVIREAEPSDASEMIQFANAISHESDFLSFGPGEFDISESKERELLEQSHAADNAVFMLATIDEAIVGTLHFAGGTRPRMRHTGEFGISVLKSFWGLGIGSALMSALIQWAQATGVVTKINLRVRTDNARAIRLYEREGFEREGTLRRDSLIDGTYYDTYLMGREL